MNKLNEIIGKFNLVTFLSFVLFVNTIIGAWNYSKASPTIDFFTWWVVPKSLSNQVLHSVYSLDSQKELAQVLKFQSEKGRLTPDQKSALKYVLNIYDGKIVMTATPFFYSVFNRIVSNQYQMDKVKFCVLSFICFIFSILLLGRRLKYSYSIIFIFLSIFMYWIGPFVAEIRVGNINQIQLLLLTLFIIFFSSTNTGVHQFIAGFLLSLCIMFKPNIYLIAVFCYLWMIINKDLKRILIFSVGMGVSVLIAFWEGVSYFNDMNIWQKWAKTLPSTLGYSFPIKHGNYSICKLVYDKTSLDLSTIFNLVLIVVFIILIFLNKKIKQNNSFKIDQRNLSDSFLIYGFGILGMLISSGLVWSHYFVLTFPIFMYLIRNHNESQLKQQWIKFAAACILFGLSQVVFLFVHSPAQRVMVMSTAAFSLLILLIYENLSLSSKLNIRTK